MGRKKNPTSEMNVAEKMNTPLAQRLESLITDGNALKDFLGCSIQAVNQYKLGTSRPSLENLSKIADYYGVSTDYLLGRTDIKAADTDKRAMCEYSGLTESALELLHSFKDNPDYSRIISAILEDKTFQAILPQIPDLERVKLGVELERFGSLAPVKERWTKEGYLVGIYDYFDMLEFRIAQELKLVISSITNPDIDWAKGAITIRRNAQYTPAAGVYVTSPKNGKSRMVDVGPDVLKLLQQLRLEQSEKAISRYVFTQDNSPEIMHPQSPTRYFKKFGQRYGIEDFHPHKLRHTSASVALANGADIVSVSERLGHSDTAITLRTYAHANEEGIRRAGQVVRDALKAQG